jgi:hypothetical protein
METVTLRPMAKAIPSTQQLRTLIPHQHLLQLITALPLPRNRPFPHAGIDHCQCTVSQIEI